MSEYYFEAVEVCPHCRNENIYSMWNTEILGYITVCKYCGKEIMLCDECIHAEDELNKDCCGCNWHKTECGGKCFRGTTKD